MTAWVLPEVESASQQGLSRKSIPPLHQSMRRDARLEELVELAGKDGALFFEGGHVSNVKRIDLTKKAPGLR